MSKLERANQDAKFLYRILLGEESTLNIVGKVVMYLPVMCILITVYIGTILFDKK
jgi:hypothetical protein